LGLADEAPSEGPSATGALEPESDAEEAASLVDELPDHAGQAPIEQDAVEAVSAATDDDAAPLVDEAPTVAAAPASAEPEASAEEAEALDALFSEEAPAQDPYAPAEKLVRSAPTRKIPRVRLSGAKKPSFPLVRKGPSWKRLEPRVRPYAEQGATFRVTLRGSLVGTTEGLESVQAIVEAFAHELESIEAKLEAYVVLYSRG
jgi:hypothetical protein